MVARVEGSGKIGKLDEGNEKVQITSYKISHMNVMYGTIYCQ